MGQGLGQSDQLPSKQFRRLPSGLRHSVDWFGWFDPQEHLTRKERKRPQEPAYGAEASDRERKRRAAGGQRRTVLTGALGPASSRGSVLSGY